MNRIPARKPGKQILAAVAGAAALALAGCSTSSSTAGSGTAAAGPVDTGTYPNLNIAPKAAAAPISPQEKAAMVGQLGAAQNAQTARGATPSTANPALLRKIAQKHAQDTLEEIEDE